MGPHRYLPFLPITLNWIQQTIGAHAHKRRAVLSFNFPRQCPDPAPGRAHANPISRARPRPGVLV
jgi:hypothetical protein